MANSRGPIGPLKVGDEVIVMQDIPQIDHPGVLAVVSDIDSASGCIYVEGIWFTSEGVEVPGAKRWGCPRELVRPTPGTRDAAERQALTVKIGMVIPDRDWPVEKLRRLAEVVGLTKEGINAVE